MKTWIAGAARQLVLINIFRLWDMECFVAYLAIVQKLHIAVSSVVSLPMAGDLPICPD